MKILWITQESILPANTGGRIGVFKRLEQLSKTEEIYLFYPYDNEDELAQISELKKYCAEVHAYSRKKNKLNAIKLLYKYPYTVGSRCIKEMQKDILTCIEKHNIDIINVDFPHLCVNLLNSNLSLPIVLNEHNIEWMLYRRISRSQSSLLKKLAYYVDSFRLKSYEDMILKEIPIKAFTFVSDKDKRIFIDEHGIKKDICFDVPVGSDIRNIKNKQPSDTKSIIFVGKMSYGPNEEAAEWFAKKIFPKIIEEISNVKFYIVGKEPSEKVKMLASENVIVTGSVDSVEPYYEAADLVVIPLQNGGGVKVKLLEAVSFSKPIVSTSVGVEGTIYSQNNTIPIADDEGSFASCCIDALKGKGDSISSEAYKVFLEQYTWEGICRKYRKILKNISIERG